MTKKARIIKIIICVVLALAVAIVGVLFFSAEGKGTH